MPKRREGKSRRKKSKKPGGVAGFARPKGRRSRTQKTLFETIRKGRSPKRASGGNESHKPLTPLETKGAKRKKKKKKTVDSRFWVWVGCGSLLGNAALERNCVMGRRRKKKKQTKKKNKTTHCCPPMTESGRRGDRGPVHTGETGWGLTLPTKKRATWSGGTAIGGGGGVREKWVFKQGKKSSGGLRPRVLFSREPK